MDVGQSIRVCPDFCVAGSRIISARPATNAERRDYEDRKDAAVDLPVYLDPDVRRYLTERAKAKGVEVSQLVNELLKRDIALIEAAT